MYAADERARRGARSPEEEIAVIIDNMHRSERGMWLRTQYDSAPHEYSEPGTTRLPGRHFVMQAVGDYHRRVPPLAARLARIEQRRCPYNPFRDYRQLPVNARP